MRIGVFKGYSTDERVKNTIEAFIQGLAYINADYFVATEYEDCDVAVIWGITSNRAFKKTKYRDQIREKQRHTIVIERGFIKRDLCYSVGWRNTGGLGEYCNEDVKSDRWKKLNVSIQPWQNTGPKILLCGQVPHDTSVQHIDYMAWLRNAISIIKKNTNREIVFRSHPLYQGGYKLDKDVEYSTSTLAEDLKSAHSVVTFNSTTGVDSIIAGVPTFSFDRRSMAYDVSAHDFELINDPVKPDRTQWAHKLAYSQWHIDEIKRGKPWIHLQSALINN